MNDQSQTSIPTPDLSHLKSADYEQVYEPAEDSFLLLDALEMELDKIIRLNPQVCVEVGSGSGIISTALSLKLPYSYFIVTDVNVSACKVTLATAACNKTRLEVINTRTLSGLMPRLCDKVDVLLCNPPYVATEEQETGHDDIKASWAGGDLGMSVTNEVVDLLRLLLSQNGVAYIVLEQCNKPQKVEEYVRSLGLNFETVITRRAGIELLSVVKISKKL